MATYYWVGGGGTWDTTTTTHWASSSGGTGGAGVPTSVDTVYFDSASNATAYTVSVGSGVICANLNISNPPSGKVTIGGSSQLTITTSLTTPDNYSIATSILAFAPSPGNTCQVITNWVTGSGATGTKGLSVANVFIGADRNAQYGTVQIYGPINIGTTFGGIYIYGATLDITNNTLFKCAVFSVEYAAPYTSAVLMNDATVTTTDYSTPVFFASQLTTSVYNTNSKFLLTGYTAPNLPQVAATTGAVIPPLVVNNGKGLQLSSSDYTVASITISGGQSLKLTSGANFTVNRLVVTDVSPTNRFILSSTGAGTTNLTKNGGAINLEYADISDIRASGVTQFNAWQSTATNTTGFTVKSTKRPPPAAFLIFC